jgi:hypothetical protein
MPEDLPAPGMRPEPRFMSLPAGSHLWRITKQPKNEWPPRPAEARGQDRPGHGGWPDFAGTTIPAGIAQLARLSQDPEPAARSTGFTSVFREFSEAKFDPEFAGRFDPTEKDPYSYCYAAFDDLTAICEVLLRDQSFQSPTRYLPKKAVEDYQLTILETRAHLWLVSLLDAADLAAVGQDSWLIHAESAACYKITREWARSLRDTGAPDGNGPAGLVWPSKREPGGRSVLLFGDRCANSVVYSPFGVRPLDHGEGKDWLNRRLEVLCTRVHEK